jgi:hypothetical protein
LIATLQPGYEGVSIESEIRSKHRSNSKILLGNYNCALKELVLGRHIEEEVLNSTSENLDPMEVKVVMRL